MRSKFILGLTSDETIVKISDNIRPVFLLDCTVVILIEMFTY